jgi:tetratricopeptide (TPR) repeat protein
MINLSKVVAIAALIAMATPLDAQAQSAAPTSGDNAAPQVAASMSLYDAKNLIQKWKRWLFSDSSPDVVQDALEFGSDRIVFVAFSSPPQTYRVCPYEAFDPVVEPEPGVNQAGKHKGIQYFGADTGKAGDDGCISVGVGTPSRDIATSVAAAMLRWKNSTLAERQALPEQIQQAFAPVAAEYRAKKTKPEIPEDVRRFKVMAEADVADKRFSDAVDAYESGIALAPWWPEGHFNEALMLGELHYFDEAIEHMKKYLALVPDAADARAAQDKIYVWESKRQAEFQ